MQLQELDLNLLIVLRELLEHRSVSRAAEQLGRTQSAVSHSLARLRDTFDDPLLVRAGRGLEATPLAESLVEPVQRALDHVGSVFLTRGSFTPQKLERHFTIVAADYAETVVIPRLWPVVRERAPGVDLDVRFVGDDVDREVQTGRVDLALGANFRDFPGLFHRPLYREELAVASRRRPGRRRWTLDRYLAADHVLVAPRGRAGSMVDDLLADMGRARRVVLTTPHFLVALFLVAETDAVVTLPRQLAMTCAARLSLDVKPPPFTPPAFTFGLLYRETSRFDPAHEWLRDTIAEVCADLQQP